MVLVIMAKLNSLSAAADSDGRKARHVHLSFHSFVHPPHVYLSPLYEVDRCIVEAISNSESI